MRNNLQLLANKFGSAGQGQYYLLPCLIPPEILKDQDLIMYGWIIEKSNKKKFYLDRKKNRFSYKEAILLSGHYDLEKCSIDDKLQFFDKKMFEKIKLVLKTKKNKIMQEQKNETSNA